MKAIETRYKGYRFRSRLEARWAVFFSNLGVNFRYEEQGFNLGGLYYLPDFWLPNVGQGCFVEVNPDDLTEQERQKAYRLALESNQFVMCFCGSPWIGEHKVIRFKKLPEPRQLVVDLAERLIQEKECYGIFRSIVIFAGCRRRELVERMENACGQHLHFREEDKSEVLVNESFLCYCDLHNQLSFGGVVEQSGICSACGFPNGEEFKEYVPRCFYAEQNNDEVYCSPYRTGGKLQAAFNAARAARFEHGECG